MTPERTRRVIEAIGECDRYIAKEGVRSAALRPADIVELLAKYKAHRATLVAMLKA